MKPHLEITMMLVVLLMVKMLSLGLVAQSLYQLVQPQLSEPSKLPQILVLGIMMAQMELPKIIHGV
jgi:hypothetical protein